jgi:hypothetical protein
MVETSTRPVIVRAGMHGPYRRFGHRHQPEMLDDLVADDCVMESIQPAPDGTRLAVLEA